mgnify:CR=1 FL=1
MKHPIQDMLSVLKMQHEKYYNATLPSSWTISRFEYLPEQPNCHDCGPFICEYGDFITRRMNIDFGENNGPEIRKRIANEIEMKKLTQRGFKARFDRSFYEK